PGRDFAVLNLVSSANRRWTVGTAPDTFLVLDGRTMPFGSTTAGFTCEDISVSSDASTLRLDATFALSRSSLRITRHYRVTSGSPTFETWNTYTPSDKGVATLSDLNGFKLTLPNGRLHWLTGLQGDTADVAHDSAFTLQQKQLAIGESLSLGPR